MSVLRKGDVGVIFRNTVKDQDDAVVDISSATTNQIKITKPDGTVFVATAVFTDDGEDGQHQFVTTSEVLTQVGVYKITSYIILTSPAGTWHSTDRTIKVDDIPS